MYEISVLLENMGTAETLEEACIIVMNSLKERIRNMDSLSRIALYEGTWVVNVDHAERIPLMFGNIQDIVFNNKFFINGELSRENIPAHIDVDSLPVYIDDVKKPKDTSFITAGEVKEEKPLPVWTDDETPPCFICGKIHKRANVDAYVYVEPKLLCVDHPGVMKYYEEELQRSELEYARYNLPDHPAASTKTLCN